MSNALNLQHPVTVPAETPYVTVQHGLKVVPDTLALSVISHTSTAAPTFTQVFADSNVVSWQWTNPEAGTVVVVQASCTVTRDVNNGTFSGPPVVSATLALTPVSTGITPVEAIYQGGEIASLADNTESFFPIPNVITDTANAGSNNPNFQFVVPADGTYLVLARFGINWGNNLASKGVIASMNLYGPDYNSGTSAHLVAQLGTTLPPANPPGPGVTAGQSFFLIGSKMFRCVQGDVLKVSAAQRNQNAGNASLSVGEIEIQRVR